MKTAKLKNKFNQLVPLDLQILRKIMIFHHAHTAIAVVLLSSGHKIFKHSAHKQSKKSYRSDVLILAHLTYAAEVGIFF